MEKTKYQWVGGARNFQGAYTVLDRGGEICYCWSEDQAKRIVRALENNWKEQADLEIASNLSGRKVDEIKYLKPGEGRK